jgi:sugar lactone lactonase YvrE
VADDGVNVVFRVDPVTGNRTIISGSGSGSGPGFSSPSGVAVEADGKLVVADWRANAVFRVDQVTGTRTILSNAGAGSGPVFGDPYVLAVEADGNLVVADGGVNAVFRVDPVTGDRTIVSNATTGSGPALGSPGAITVAADGGLLVVSDGIAGVFRIDPVTGDRMFVSGGTTAVKDNSGRLEIPQDYALSQNYPNPFNPSTVISFQLPVSNEVELAVYNSSGQIVRTLSQGQMASGTHSVAWDGTNDTGARVASGVYLYALKAGEVTLQRKLVLMK